MAQKPDEKAENGNEATSGNGSAQQQTLNILAQYVKDLSFESPGAPLSLRPRENFPLLCDVDVLYKPSATPAVTKPAEGTKALPAPARHKGPAQVATDVYRDNWDSIWSSKKPSALN